MAEQPDAGQEGGAKPDPRFFRLHNRITRLEKKLNTFDDRIQMIEGDMTEKHKETMERLTEVNSNISSFKTELTNLREFIERVNKRMAEFASKESVKTLEKYINLWNPLNYLKKTEIKKMIDVATGKPRAEKLSAPQERALTN